MNARPFIEHFKALRSTDQHHSRPGRRVRQRRALAAADLARLADASVVVVRVRNPQTESAPHESRSSMLQAMRGAAEVVGLGVPRGLNCEVLDGDDVPNAVLGRPTA
jgi:hypothetical protein